MDFIDTHSHLYDEQFVDDIDELLIVKVTMSVYEIHSNFSVLPAKEGKGQGA